MAMTGGTAVLLKTGYPNYGSETNFPLHLYLYYKIVSQNKATAVTTMSLGMYFVCPDEWYVGPWSDYGSYLGTTANTFSKSVPSNFSGTLWLAENVTFNVQHDAQGKGTAKIAWKWGVDSSYGQFESPSGTYSVSLPDIPRASSVSVGGAVNAGSALAISIGRASSSFTHTLRYVFGSASGTIATGVGTSYNWSVPFDLLRQIPSATSGTGTIYCDTYYSGTAIGTSSCAFTINAPNNESTKPTASMMLSPSGSVPSAFSGMYIQGKTAVKADFTAEPKYGTSIKSYAISVNGKTTSGDPSTSAVLSVSGETTVTGTVTDARGFSRVLTEKITVQYYGAPAVVPGAGQTSVICERADANGIASPSGTYLRIVANRKYSSVAGANACTLRYRFKQSSASSYGEWVTLLAAGSSGDGYSGALSGIVSSVTTSYDVQIGVVDTMGTESAITFHIPTDEVSFHIREGGKGAAFFGYSEKDDELSLSGRKITNVGTPADAGDAVPLGYAQGAFAPHGHGLGLATGSLTVLSTPAEADACTKAGWYEYYSSTTLNGPGTQYGGIFVIPSMWSVTQFFFCRMYYGCCMKRIYQDGVWQPWEWINPPMASGVEYRTTERWQGKPVYVKLLSLGNLPNATEKAVYHNIANLDYPLSITAGAKSSDWSFALPLTESSLTKFTFNYQHIAIKCTGNWSGYTAYATLKYTKS